MKYKITLNMPSYQGRMVHQIIAEHEADSIEDLLEGFAKDGFGVVTEWYKSDNGPLEEHGPIGINYMVIGKVSYLEDFD